MTAKEQRDVALDELNVDGIIEAIEEYVTARLNADDV
jgi:hypothetical protein